MLRKFLSYGMAVFFGLLAVAPPMPYDVPLIVNSFAWLYGVVALGLAAFFLLHSDLHALLKALLIYLFLNAFLSQAPYLSFNAFILLVGAVVVFMAFQRCDFKIILDMAVAVFWFQLLIALLQYVGKDTLMSFTTPKDLIRELGLPAQEYDVSKGVFFGTLFQAMRFSSLYAILSPLLLIRSKWYIVPILVTAVAFNELGYTFAVMAGIFVYAMMTMKRHKMKVFWFLFVAALVLAVRDWQGVWVCIHEGRLPVWGVILKTWVLDTTGPMGKPDWLGISQTGPFDWMRFVFGHGTDTFLPLFPVYKHDINPFPQAHNDWLQILWETGLVGFSLVTGYCASLIYRLNRIGAKFEVACLAIVAVNMFFHFPMRMTQTMLPMLAFLAYCEARVRHQEDLYEATS